MKAARVDRYGTPADIRIEEVGTPVPADDQVLVRVRAASVNRADLDGIQPRPQFVRLFVGIRRPRNHKVGLDVAGVVEAVGPAVTRFKPGDRVFADLYAYGGGAFAEFACAKEKAFLPIPDGLSFEDAATLPHAANLAVQGLRRRDGRTPGPGDRVMVSGASGNVGPFAVQIAKHLGAEVTGVARTEKLEFVRSLGADHVIDYTTTDITKAGERYDWIVDTDSHHSMLSMRRVLRPGGVYITLGGTDLRILDSVTVGPIMSLAGSRTYGLMLWWKPFHEPDITTVTRLIAEGKVKPRIDRTYPLEQVVDALKWVDEGHAKGKVLVIP
ncbi:MAG TPA: NAD(P)-dependent alcohol dehydrogenase [Candidatus Limnocylindrales bacterium]|nr:NAD(P)-dependent alcohol dehydrogenase [Candidatus Limnocylindrales bacterium]